MEATQACTSGGCDVLHLIDSAGTGWRGERGGRKESKGGEENAEENAEERK